MEAQNNIERFHVNINEYEIVKQIGCGALCIVYLVKKRASNEPMVAKVMMSMQNDEERTELPLQLFEKLKRISAPTIIPFYGFSPVNFSGENRMTFLVGYAPHGPLSEVITDESHGKCPIEYDATKKQIILCGIAHGMMILHSHDLFHGYLTRQNVFLDENYNPFITCFSVAKTVDPFSQQNLTGTLGPLYMAPEILVDEKYGLEADVYSFGLLMFEVITGERAFEDFIRKRKFNMLRLVHQIIEGLRPAFHCPVKPILKSLIEQCWHSDPNQRPTFQEIFNVLSLANVQENHKDPDPTGPSIACLDDVDIDRFLDYVTEITPSNS